MSQAQVKSETYMAIAYSDTISNNIKEQKIDSLLSAHKKNNRLEFLIGDTYDFARWQKKYGSNDRSINLNKRCLFLIDSLAYEDLILKKKALYNLAVGYKRKSDYLNAYKYFNELAEIKEINNLTYKAYRLRADNISFSGDYFRAAKLYDIAISFNKKHKRYEDYLDCSVNAALNYRKINSKESLDKGINLLNNAITDIMALSDSEDIKGISLTTIISIYLELGILHSDRPDHNFEKGKASYQKALEYAQQLNDSIDLANIYNGLGLLYLKDNRKEAISYFNRALSYKPYVKTEQVIYKNKSKYFSNLKLKDSALYNIQKSINTVAPFNYTSFKNLPSKSTVSRCNSKFVLLYSLVNKAEICIKFSEEIDHASGLYSEALDAIYMADFLVDKIRLESNDNDSKLFWRKIASEIYANGVKISYELNRLSDAFYFIEKAKALLLLEDVNKKQLRQYSSLPSSISKREETLKKALNFYSNYAAENEKKQDSILRLGTKAHEAYYQFVDSLETKYRLLYKTLKSPYVLPLEQLKNDYLSTTNKTIIEYIVNDDYAFGMLITKHNTEVFEIGNVDTLKHLSTRFRSFLESPLTSKAQTLESNNISNALYNRLLPEKIRGKIEGRHVIIIPDYFLQNIPFSALQTSKNQNSYLINDFEISYAYSMSFLIENSEIKRNNNGKLLGFAPVDFNDRYPSLPQSQKEIDNIDAFFSTTTFTKSDATKNEFLSKVNEYSIIHIASHASTKNTSNPWIAFSETELSLDELYTINSSSNLVVLSACETSLGELNQGEGIMSLARGFFNTGTESVISSLWKVNDKSTSKIMTNFYRNLKRGESKSDALRNAKLEYLNSHTLSETSPYYWSSFVLIGEHDKVSQHSNMHWLYILASALVILFLFKFMKKKL